MSRVQSLLHGHRRWLVVRRARKVAAQLLHLRVRVMPQPSVQLLAELAAVRQVAAWVSERCHVLQALQLQ